MFSLSLAISTFVQFGLFLVIPFAQWASTARHSVGFASRIGLCRPTWDRRRARLGVTTLAWVVIGATSTALPQSLSGDVPATRFVGRGLGSLVPVLLFVVMQTSFTEELFFRGFLDKRATARWGFAPGDTVQAIAFGILRVVMFASFAGPIWLLAVGILTGASGWIVGWLNEERAGGSILPGWALHAGVNLPVRTTAAFNLVGRARSWSAAELYWPGLRYAHGRLRGNVCQALRTRSVSYDVLGVINVEIRKGTHGANERLICPDELGPSLGGVHPAGLGPHRVAD